VTSGSETGRLVLTSRTPGTLLRVFDSTLRVLATGRDQLTADLRPGVYRIESRLGDARTSELVTIAPGADERHDLTVEFATAAPTYGTSTSYETHTDFATRLSLEVATGVGPKSGAVLVLRNLAGRDRYPMRSSAVTLLNQALHPVSEWASDWVEDQAHDDITGRAGRLEPGPYVLRVEHSDRDGTVETADQTIWLSPDWQTLVFIPNGPDGPDARAVSVHMGPLGARWQGYEPWALAAEAALAGLRDGVPSVPADLINFLLNSKFENPMLGILGMHALLVAGAPEQRLLRTVVQNLLRLIPDHPDVQALAVLLPDAASQSVPWPPMLASSYRRCLLPADLDDPNVLPAGSPAERVAPYVLTAGPWLRWTATTELLSEERTPRAAIEQVDRIVGGMAEFHDTDRATIVDRFGISELARRARLPETLTRAALRDLGIAEPAAVMR
jgi:hypothetical protein